MYQFLIIAYLFTFNLTGLGHDTIVRQHSKVSPGGTAELSEKHVHTKKTSTPEFMQSGQILVGALCVDNDSGLNLVWKIHESAFEMHSVLTVCTCISIGFAVHQLR